MRAKIWTIISIVVLLGVIAYAQGPAGSSITITNAVTCPTPGLGVFSFCKPSAGGPVTYTDEGSAYAKASLIATPGPAGPTGAQGPQGPPGATGPTGVMPSSYSCTSVTISATGVWTFSGCK